jgi:hypothetical protein
MKHQTTRLLKFKELQNRLDLPMWQVIGMLETLWHVTLVHAPAGDIGKFTNEQIAALMDYRGDIDSLLETLLEKGWIDADPEFRLIVHDWSFHAPTYLKGAFAKHSRQFADQIARHRPLSTPARALVPSSLVPNQEKTRNTPPPPPTPSSQQPAKQTRKEEGEEVVSLEGDWIGLERPLRACGVTESAPALAAARKAGCTPAEVGMLIGHFEAHPKAWTPGLLYARIKSLRPGDDPSKGWPEPSHEHKQLVEAQRPAKALAPSREQLMAENAARVAALEEECGPALDGLPPERLEKFLRHTFEGKPNMLERYRRNPKDALCREWLLLALKKCKVNA